MSRILSLALILAATATPSDAAPKWARHHRRLVIISAAVAAAVGVAIAEHGHSAQTSTAPFSKLRIGVYQ